MRLLVLGGTRFVGRHIVEAARDAGHDVAIFHRGRSNRGLWPDVEEILGDRETDLSGCAGRHWDAVVDTSGYVPRVVKASLGAFGDSTSLYAFVSTISVYRTFDRPRLDESAPLAELDDPTSEEIGGEKYGGLKALCEREVGLARGDEGLIVRPGIIVGPHDYTDRFTYWVDRIARGGTIACPGPRDASVQFIDARDLGRWIVKMVEERNSGTFNAVGPARRLTMETWFDAIRETTGSDANLVWVGEEDLERAGLGDKMPMWASRRYPNLRYMMEVDASKAIAAGLRHRPVAATVRDTLEWFRTEGDAMSVGPSPVEEENLLAATAEVG